MFDAMTIRICVRSKYLEYEKRIAAVRLIETFAFLLRVLFKRARERKKNWFTIQNNWISTRYEILH
jgi:hypothetical protein